MSEQLTALQTAVGGLTASTDKLTTTVAAAITAIGTLENPTALTPLTAAVTAAATAIDAANTSLAGAVAPPAIPTA